MKPMISLAVTALFLAIVTPTYAAAPPGPNEPGTVETSGTMESVETSGALEDLLSAATFSIEGKVEFVADYLAVQRLGQVPNGQAPLPYLHVCAWDKDDAIDFEFTDYPTEPGSGGNDELLGCDRADVDGNFNINASFGTGGESEPDIYLVTLLCDDTGEGAVSAADVCVRINAEEADADYPRNAKSIWSRVYADINPNGTTVTISWNLSCPNRSGLNSASVTCVGDTEPGNWSESSPGAADWCACQDEPWKECLTTIPSCSTCGDTNSRYGCNKEAVHVYRAAIEPYVTWGTNKPAEDSTFSKDCDTADIWDGGGDDHCEMDECQDEARFHLSNIQATAGVGFDGPGECEPETANPQNAGGDFDRICIRTPDQPFRVVHEYGHVIQNRWLCDPTDARKRVGGISAQNHATREGWANYVASKAWSVDKYCGSSTYYSMEAGGTNNGDEVSVGQFFWDLGDPTDDAGWAETEDRTFQEIRNVWSAFPNGPGPSQTRECDPGPPPGIDCSGSAGHQANGVNMLDYSYWFDVKLGPLTTSYCDTLTQNDLTSHSDSLPSDDLSVDLE